MREKLFRAKALDGTWKQGLYAPRECNDNFDKSLSQENNEPIISYVLQRLIYMPKGICSIGTECCLLDPDTLGRYTGHLDINGRQIFDGDLVEVHINGEAIPDFKNGQDAPYVIRVNADVDFGRRFGKGFLSMCKFKIIGNIYDNPELA